MKRVASFHRKRPHLLPPLGNSQYSSLGSGDPLQPPDLLLIKNRFGSPIPKQSDPKEFDYVHNEDKPVISINEPSENENEGGNFKFDLLSDSILNKSNNLPRPVQARNLRMPGLEPKKGEGENLLFRNLSKKQIEKFPQHLERNIKFQAILPLDETDKSKAGRPLCFPIPNRYKLLKPIGEGF